MRMSAENMYHSLILNWTNSILISATGSTATIAMWLTKAQPFFGGIVFVSTMIYTWYCFYCRREERIRRNEEWKYQRLKDESKKLSEENEAIKKDRQGNGGC